MGLELYIFALFAGLFVFMYRVGKNVIDEIKRSKYYTAETYLTLTTEPLEEEGDHTVSNWMFISTITFPLPPSIGQEVQNVDTSYIVKEVLVTKERGIRVIFEDQTVHKPMASDAIEHLYQDGWEYYDNSIFSDPLPPRGEKYVKN